jgi:DNA-binding MurR/RpiR family transcriptional regulator
MKGGQIVKIFATQTIGFLQKIAAEEELALEDGARLLAQAVIGDGRILLHGVGEMEAIVIEALYGPDPLPKATRLMENGRLRDDIDETDRVLLITRFSNDNDAVRLAEQLKSQGVETVAISALVKDEPSLADIVDVHIDSKLQKPVVPKEDGSRIGMPTVIAASFAYYCLLLMMDDILEEYE